MKGVTDKQLEVLQLVSTGATPGSGDAIDFDQLLEALSWKPTKQAAQFTIRALVDKGFIVKAGQELRRGRKRVVYQLTKSGKLVLDPRPEPVRKDLPFVPEFSVEANPEVFGEGEEEVIFG